MCFHCSGEHLPLWLCRGGSEGLSAVWQHQDAHVPEQARPAAAHHAGEPQEARQSNASSAAAVLTCSLTCRL